MVEFEFWWLLIIPLFFGLGWFAARIDIAQIISESTDFPSAYFKGLNFLIKNQYEKAAEAFSHAVKINNESIINEKLIITKDLFKDNKIRLSLGKKRHIKVILT